MSNSREQILLTTCDLLENQGYNATGLNEIVRASGAPKGSIYYYFPAGKEEIVAEAILLAGRRTSGSIRANLSEAADPGGSVRAFVETIASHVEESGFTAGGPLTIVASETATTSERINQACRAAYDQIRGAFADRLVQNGMDSERAEGLSWMITSAVEGAIILSRTYHSGDPLREAARRLECLIGQCR